MVGAEKVVIVMGCGGETIQETVNYLNGQGQKTGVLKVRLYRPFSVKHFAEALPASVKKISVLDRTKEPGCLGEPLYEDVRTAIGEAMAKMGNINRESLDHVLDDFHADVGDQTELGVGNEDYLRNVLIGALGDDKAGGILDRILMGHNSKGLETLKWMEPRAIAEVIRLEHPQIIAIILSYLESDQSASIMQSLPENMRTDVLLRIATLDGIQPSALYELDEMLEQQFAGKKHYSSDFECKYVFQGGLAFCQYKELKNNPCPVYFALVEKYGKTYLEPNSILEIEFGSLAISQS